MKWNQAKVEKLYEIYRFINLSKEEFFLLLINKMKANSSNLDIHTLCWELVREELIISASPESILFSYIEMNLDHKVGSKKNLTQLYKISLFLEKTKYELSEEMYYSLLSNPLVEQIVKTIVNCNQEQMEFGNIEKLTSDEFVTTLLKYYDLEKHIENHKINIEEKEYVAYYKAISQFKRLTLEEEQQLALKALSGDEKARKKLIESNLRLVVFIAREYKNSKIPRLDLIQYGNIGLILATKKYDPARGSFGYYASFHIRKEIRRGIYKTEKMIYYSSTVQKQLNDYRETVQKLTLSLKRQPSRKEIQQQSEISIEKIQFLEQLEGDVLSLDSVILDIPQEPMEEIVDYIMKQEIQEILIKILNKRELEMITLYYGLFGHTPKNFSQIGEVFKISKSAVYQNIKRILEKMRHHKFFLELNDEEIKRKKLTK